MKFVNYIDNKDIIEECFNEVEDMELVTEGWGIKATQMGIIVGGVLVLSAVTFPFFGALKRFAIGAGTAFVSNKINDTQFLWTKDKVAKIMESKEMKEYITLACKASLKEIRNYYKSDKNVTILDKPPGNAIQFEDSLGNMADIGTIKASDIPRKYKNKDFNDSRFGYFYVDIKIPGFEVCCKADTDHIEKVIMTYGVKFKSKGKDYVIARQVALPSPTDENIKKLGYRQEDVSKEEKRGR